MGCDDKVTDRFTCNELRDRDKEQINDYSATAKCVEMVWTCFKKTQE